MTLPQARRSPIVARPRRLLFAALYFAEGAPIGFIWWALPVWLRSAGASPGEIARLVSWVAWPWALKFLWAPLVDLVRTPLFGLRGWILTSQAMMAATLIPLLFVDMGQISWLLVAVLMAHAVAAATQDAAIDTLAVISVPANERGAINGWMQTGMLAARALFGGGAVLLASRVGDRGVVVLLIVAILVPALLASAWAGEGASARPRPRAAEYLRSLRETIGQGGFWSGLLLAATVGAGFEGLASLAGPLLIDSGASDDTVGLFFLVPAVVLMALGALVGGWTSDRIGRRRATLLGQGAAALSVIAVGIAAWSIRPILEGTEGLDQVVASADHLLLLLGLVYFAAGFATAALYGLLMDLADPTAAATQFCAFMAGINLCYIWATRLLGSTVDEFGYGPGIVLGGAASLLALPLLVWVRPKATP